MRAPVLIGALLVAAVGPATADDLGAIVAARAGARLPAELGLAEVHLPASLVGLEVTPAEVDVDWPRAPRAGRASVKVHLRGPRPRTVFVPVTLAPLVEVAVAARALPVGTRVTAEDLRLERRAAARGLTAPAAIGQEVIAPLAAGELLDDAHLTAPAPVARGTEVTVRIRKGDLEVSAAGRLEVGARPGERVRARVTATRALVEGVLAGPGLVVVGGGS